MNQSTAKLLRTYAAAIGEHERGVKKWWNTLNNKERFQWRKKIQEELASDANDSNVTVEDTVQIEEVTE